MRLLGASILLIACCPSVTAFGSATAPSPPFVSERSGGYSDVGVLPDETILTLHESSKGLLLARYNFAWLASGKKLPKPFTVR